MPCTSRAIVLLTLALAGCSVVRPQDKGRSPLLSVTGANDSVTLEVFSASVPLGDPRIVDLWREVDEQSLDPQLRCRLGDNGLRAGVVGPQLSAVLAELLRITDRPLSEEERRQIPLEEENAPILRLTQMQPGKRYDQVVSPVYDEMSLLQRSAGEVRGRSYAKAEGRLAIRVFPEANARVRLELQPELHHGEFKSQVTGFEGAYMIRQVRPREVFRELKLVTALAAGQMLVLTCQADKPGSIGHYFFSDASGEKPLQKLWVLRLAQAAPDRLFSENPPGAGESIASDDAE